MSIETANMPTLSHESKTEKDEKKQLAEEVPSTETNDAATVPKDPIEPGVEDNAPANAKRGRETEVGDEPESKKPSASPPSKESAEEDAKEKEGEEGEPDAAIVEKSEPTAE